VWWKWSACIGVARRPVRWWVQRFALRWKVLTDGQMMVQETVYEGSFGPPKTEAGVRALPLSAGAAPLLTEWRSKAKRTGPEDLVFSTWSGKPISPNNVLRGAVFPVCTTLGLPNATWLTFRRTYRLGRMRKVFLAKSLRN
jgi:hypothetical protein